MSDPALHHVTRDWLVQFRTGSGGWTKAQVVALGLEWPLKRGWMRYVDGLLITDAARVAFEQGQNLVITRRGKTRQRR